ncbi:MAG TPA: hypothetical protein PKI62_07585 [bacterium]|nr:hypothetical protein [bacterium]HPR86623.1 hypothetical protein [bacterium]
MSLPAKRSAGTIRLLLTGMITITLFAPRVRASGLPETTITRTIAALEERHGAGAQPRIERGVRQAAALWREQDGSAAEFSEFCLAQFVADSAGLEALLTRCEGHLETLYGHAHEVGRDLAQPLQLEIGPVLPVDYLFAEYSPFAHLSEDLFGTRIAFTALLNFPLYSLAERLQLGASWNRTEWAQMRLANQFNTRVPAAALQEANRAYVQADDYISNYNIYMHGLVDETGRRLFPEGLKLITHWGLRDELKGQYGNKEGLARQRLIARVMVRIIRQEIPQQVIDSPTAVWAPYSNQLLVEGRMAAAAAEPDVRYLQLLATFQAERKIDPWYPGEPTKIARRFDREREIPEADFEALLTRMLTDPAAREVARLISRRLGRKLEPFDIWYNGFRSHTDYSENQLDQIVSAKYPTTAAFQAQLPQILTGLGFDAATAAWLGTKITVDPSRGAGHAMGAMRRDDNAHLRTRIPAEGMRYKGYNIAVHELGHCVEQVFSLNKIDLTLLAGVPNTAFTEAFAFVFQRRDLELLGLAGADPQARHLHALDTYWATCEIAAVGLVDMKVWHWMYAHPQATPQELKGAVLEIAAQVWNTYFAPLFGVRDVVLLAIYSHMIDSGLYLPDYALGHIISFQIERYLQDRNLGQEMERMCRLGMLTPDAWMRAAVNSPVSAEPLLQAVHEATRAIKL